MIRLRPLEKVGDADVYELVDPNGDVHRIVVTNLERLVGGASGELELIAMHIARVAEKVKS
jgi:hypothetical protein